ncbi:unnamed protein product, partial [Trichogramma brassicae]
MTRTTTIPILRWPHFNLMRNGKEVMRSFACSTQLAFSLTKTKYDLMLRPFKKAMANMQESGQQLRCSIDSVVRAIRAAVAQRDQGRGGGQSCEFVQRSGREQDMGLNDCNPNDPDNHYNPRNPNDHNDPTNHYNYFDPSNPDNHYDPTNHYNYFDPSNPDNHYDPTDHNNHFDPKINITIQTIMTYITIKTHPTIVTMMTIMTYMTIITN